MREQRKTIGNGTATAKLIADSFNVVIDPQVTSLQLWNVLLHNLKGLDVIHSYRHDNYPYGFSGIVLLSDGHVAAQYGVEQKGQDAAGELNLLISTNGGPGTQELLRADLAEAFSELLP